MGQREGGKKIPLVGPRCFLQDAQEVSKAEQQQELDNFVSG